ncbi:TPA: hypothetical protein N0F65_003174 [Lagenidium giganteum]|uniref:Inner centromere protein ARK-binding domain-containing protein n=1 Tax=Lagenidium giganteum TaxID=4803 RepID=A0AAV2Z9L0_9STRA|nr:TPA: hypothetical protein N0F65_003174 [Lagenidium giganteum]
MKKKASETGVNQHTEPTETNIKSEAPKAAADNDAAGVTSSQDAPSSQESNLKARTTAKGSLLPVTTGRSRQKRNDSISSNRSVASSQSSVTSTSSGGNSKPQAHSGVPATRKPVNLVSGLHSFTSLIDKEKENTSSATTSSGRSVPVVNALKLAEKSRLQEQKKTLDKQKRKEALMRRYEEQRKLDEEKERAEREAKIKQEKANDKKQRELELAKKRQQRLQEMRAGLEKRRAQQAAERETAKAATSSSTKSTHSTKPVPAPSAHKEPSKDKEVTTYEMSDNGESEEEDSVNSEDEGRSDKNIPKWAQRDTLERTLRAQFGPNAIDPTPSIFPDFVDSCDLEAIFETSDAKKKKRFARRTSSGNWLADRPTAREKAMYKREMGFDG